MHEFEIQGVKIGRDSRPYVLAEIGINHEGDVNLAERMIHAAGEAGADGVKFQTFRAEDLAHPVKAREYYNLFKSVELDREAHVRLARAACDAGVAFVSTPFGIPEADMLGETGVAAIKIASGDITNYPLLEHVASMGLPVILSTGMCFLDEVKEAREVLINAGCRQLAILHCVSRYPATAEELSLRAITTMLDEFPEVIGFSDHTEGTWAAPVAVALGARFIEKHFTLDRTLPGPDHSLSSEPDELRQLILSVNEVFIGLGDGIKKPCEMELKNRSHGRKGIYAARDLAAGTLITPADIKLIRPEGEISSKQHSSVTGRIIKTAVSEGDEINWGMLG